MCEWDKLHDKIITSMHETTRAQTEDIKKHINQEIEALKETIGREIKKRTELEIKFEELKNKHDILEKKLRKNKIIIFGINNNNENLCKYTTDILNQHLNLNLTLRDLNNIYTIGKQTQNKPVVIEFISYLTKVEVLKNCSKLKGTNISVSEVLNLEERKRNKILRQHLREARTKNLNSYIKNNKLYINKEAYTAEQLAENEQDTDNEEEGEIVPEQIKSAPATPNIRKRENNRIEPEDHIKDKPEGEPKKLEIQNKVTTAPIPRSSSRLTGKDTKNLRNSPNLQKQGPYNPK